MKREFKFIRYSRLFRCITVLICIFILLSYIPFHLIVNAEGEESDLTYEEITEKYLQLDSDHITEITLQYWNSEKSEWEDVPENAPVDGTYRQEIKFDLYTSSIKEHNGNIYYKIPKELKAIQGSENIYNGEQIIGTIKVFEDLLLIHYDLNVIDLNKSNFLGDVKVNQNINIENISENGEIIISNGTTEIKIKLEKDAFYKYAGLTVRKENPVVGFNEEGNYYYLDYKINLTAESDMSKAVVIDSFTEGNKYIHSYMNLTNEETDIVAEQAGNEKNTVYRGKAEESYTTIPSPSTEEPGVLVWSAYNLKKGETRTISYRVRLKPEFSQQANPSAFGNNADAYSATNLKDYTNIYIQDSAHSSFQPKANIELQKTNLSVETDENGQEYAEYKVTIIAPDDNLYTLNNVVIHDWFAKTSEGKLVYDFDSFTLKEVKSAGGGEGSGEVVKCNVVKGTEQANCAEVTLEKLEPGQVMELKYRVWIKPEIYLNYSGYGQFTNYAQTSIGGTNVSNKAEAKIVNVGKQWSRKNVNSQYTTSEQTMTMDGSVLDIIDNKYSKSSTTEFIIPEKSYKYQVIVNEAGYWDVSGTTFQDSFNNNMAYVGYAKVEAVDVSNNEILPSDNFEKVLKTMENCEVVKTVWLKIDGQSSFSFTPINLGFLEGNYAYRITYYAKQINNATMTAINTFKLIGTVDKDSNEYTLSLNGISAELQIAGDKQCTLMKESWYYTTPDEDNNFYKDRITNYWVIRATGDLEGGKIKFKDEPGSSFEAITSDSLVGVYVGSADTIFNAYYSSVEDLAIEGEDGMNKLGLRVLTSEIDYKNDNGVVTLLKDLELQGGEQLFLIYRTKFIYDISTYEANQRFTTTNKAAYSYDGEHWSYSEQVDKVVSSSKEASKTNGGIYNYDGIQWEELNTEKTVYLPTTDGMEPGIYVSWFIKLNQLGSLNGKATVIDTIPDGLSFSYVSLQSIGSWLDGHEPISAKPDEVFLSDLSVNEYDMENEGVYISKNKQNGEVLADEKVYYDSEKRTIIWSVDNLRNEGVVCENYFVTFRVLCRVDDMDFIGGQVKSFTNNAKVYSNLGEQKLNNTVDLNVESIKKSGDNNTAAFSGTYPFTIQVNPQGIDLVQNSNKVILIDEMNSALSLRQDTLSITNSITGEKLNADIYPVTIKYEKEKTLIEFTLPDSTPITIKYNARVNAPPETKVSISNVAYWKGYDSQVGASVIDSSFRYEIAGTGSTYHTNCTLKITKKSSANIFSPALTGAVYSIYPITLDNNNLPKRGQELTGEVVSENGVYTYNFLDYNTIYCVLETIAPEGYLVDETPHYIAIADSRDSEKYNIMTKNIELLEKNGIHVNGWFSSDTMELMLTDDLDTRYKLIVNKIAGDTNLPLIGVGFTLYQEASSDASGAILLDTTDGSKYCIPIGTEQITQLNDKGNAVVSFSELVGDGNNIYYLAETTGVTGYLKMNSAIPIQATTIEDSNGDIIVNALVNGIEKQVYNQQLDITLTNYAKLDMPSSGGFVPSNVFINIGAILTIISLGIIPFILKK